MDKVSIIIPTYGSNTDPCRAIESVFNQSYKNIEVVVVDDNGKGTDQQKGNEAIFKKYEDDRRFKYIVHELNKGGSAARNTGVINCSGDYLCFLDDDDFFSDQDKVQKQISVSETLDDSWAGTYSSLHKCFGSKPIREIKAKYSGYIVREYINGKTSIGTGSPIIRKRCFIDIGGFDETFKRHQDWEFYSRLTDRFKLKAVPEAYYDRCYKTDVGRRSIETRIEYMNKYTAKMEECLTSIPKRELVRLMRRKYIGLVYGLIREKRFRDALRMMKEKSFGIGEYLSMSKFIVLYIYHRLKYGSHF